MIEFDSATSQIEGMTREPGTIGLEISEENYRSNDSNDNKTSVSSLVSSIIITKTFTNHATDQYKTNIKINSDHAKHNTTKMGWSCEACTYRNLSDSAKSCITCGTVRNKRKQPIVELMATEDENAASSRLVPSERNAAFEKRPASSTQRTLFGGVVDETNKGKPAKKAKPSSKKTSMQSSIEENNDTAYASTEQKQQAPIPATVSHQSTLTQNRSLASYRPMSQDSFQTLKQRARQLLTEVFGIEDLRNQQPKAIKCALKGQSCIVVMATGGGKSLCYQLPALTRGGTTIVISPLIALMKDQVNALVQKGVAAAAICSANTQKENTNVMERMLGRSMSTTTNKKKADEQVFLPLTLVYCTPELLQTQRFQNVMEELHKKNRLSFIAIDEAHCMSSWGHDFRPAYRKLDYVRRAFPQVPCMALTATATANVIADIRQNLLMPESVPCHVGSFDRPNIFYKVRYKDYLDATMDGGSLADMVKFITKHHERAKEKGSPIAGIIYCHKRDDTQFLAKEIEKCTKIPSAGYHGGMKDADRTKIQEEWTSGKVKIVCATISFGMGIDLDCVRYVIHWSIPKSMSGFYQESGRGKDNDICSLFSTYTLLSLLFSLSSLFHFVFPQLVVME